MNHRSLASLILMILLGCGSLASQELPPLIPKPSKLTMGKGSFTFDSATALIVPANSPQLSELAAMAAGEIHTIAGFAPAVRRDKRPPAVKNMILVRIAPRLGRLGAEGYALDVRQSVILVEAPAAAGIWYGLQSLLQLLPPGASGTSFAVPVLRIEDRPRFAWRGMHLDVCRHFFPVAFVKRYIDYIAMYKMNTLHWHLTDDQGWRIEIKRYPKLTEVGAWRSGTMVGAYSLQQFDSVRYGGFYTQEEVKEVVAYARKRHVTVVPEIEMPGHSLAALASYPELSCTGGPFEVAKGWGVFPNVFCPKETTFTFLQNVLTEVCALFPGKYIHIGGDECPKDRWKECASCQALMKKLRLKNENQLQSYFIRRIEKFVNKKGKQIIGWDEILEGGLAPNAAVMSWRGTAGGVAAARERHKVVMCPGSHCYFDHYQGEPEFEPLAIGGYTTVEKVYSYEPIPAQLKPSRAKYVLGAQGNVWTEYIPSEEQAEYMAMPRMAALAEVLWSPKKGREYAEFQERLIRHFAFLDAKKVNYSRSIFQVKLAMKQAPAKNGVLAELSSPFGGSGIHYTSDGTPPSPSSPQYVGALPVNASGVLKFCYVDRGVVRGRVAQQALTVTKSTGRSITLKTPPHENYPGDGAFTLVDGIRGDLTRYGKNWIGFWGPDLEAVIDLGRQEAFSRVSLDVFDGEGSWIYLPKRIEVFVSNDGEHFTSVKNLTADEIRRQAGSITMDLGPQSAHYVKVFAQNAGTIQPGKQGAGSASWLFVDEIMVE